MEADGSGRHGAEKISASQKPKKQAILRGYSDFHVLARFYTKRLPPDLVIRSQIIYGSAHELFENKE